MPTAPSAQDWREAAASMWAPIPGPFTEPDGTRWPSWVQSYADPLGALVARARDRMRTRYCSSPAYAVYIEHHAAERNAQADAADAARRQRDSEKTAKQWAAEFEHFEQGGTEESWTALQQEKAEAAKVAAIRRAATKPRRKRAPSPKETT